MFSVTEAVIMNNKKKYNFIRKIDLYNQIQP